jgi:phosphatidylethanolamine-binding protein (PEBP) family uncharacterized protein
VKITFCLFLIAVGFFSFACSDVSPDAVELAVDFSWEGIQACSMGNPEIRIGGLPENTRYLVVDMYDSVYMHDHGEVTLANDGSGIIKLGAIEELQGPCPPDVPGRYKITIKALDENRVVIGSGSKRRYFPEEK